MKVMFQFILFCFIFFKRSFDLVIFLLNKFFQSILPLCLFFISCLIDLLLSLFLSLFFPFHSVYLPTFLLLLFISFFLLSFFPFFLSSIFNIFHYFFFMSFLFHSFLSSFISIFLHIFFPFFLHILFLYYFLYLSLSLSFLSVPMTFSFCLLCTKFLLSLVSLYVSHHIFKL